MRCVKKSDIARSFNDAAKTYDQHAFIQKEIGGRLLSRLSLLKQPTNTILDIGSGTGFLTRQLQQQYPHSRIVGLDLAPKMVDYANSQQHWKLWKKQPRYLCGDAECLPFPNQSFDMIFSNFTLQWCADLKAVFSEFKRVLKPNGVVFFSTLGPQTLFELKASWANVSPFVHVNEFIDMHDLGDLLLNTQFNAPVMDMEMVTVTYPHVKQLLQDLKATGAHNLNQDRPHSCTPKSHFSRMLAAYDAFRREDGLYPATFEILYGHAWLVEKNLYSQDEDGIVRIPADKIPILPSF